MFVTFEIGLGLALSKIVCLVGWSLSNISLDVS